MSTDTAPPLAPDPTATGLAPNVAGALAYLLGPLTGIAFLVLEKDNRFVRFHAAQSVAVGVALVILSIAFSVASAALAVVPVLGWIIAIVAGLVFALVTFVLWAMLMLRAFQGREWVVPVVGKHALQYSGARTAA